MDRRRPEPQDAGPALPQVVVMNLVDLDARIVELLRRGLTPGDGAPHPRRSRRRRLTRDQPQLGSRRAGGAGRQPLRQNRDPPAVRPAPARSSAPLRATAPALRKPDRSATGHAESDPLWRALADRAATGRGRRRRERLRALKT